MFSRALKVAKQADVLMLLGRAFQKELTTASNFYRYNLVRCSYIENKTKSYGIQIKRDYHSGLYAGYVFWPVYHDNFYSWLNFYQSNGHEKCQCDPPGLSAEQCLYLSKSSANMHRVNKTNVFPPSIYICAHTKVTFNPAVMGGWVSFVIQIKQCIIYHFEVLSLLHLIKQK